HVRLVQVPGEGAFGDPVRVQPSGGDLAPDRADRVGDLRPAAVVDAHGQRAGGVGGGEPFGLLQLGDHRAPQAGTATGPAHPHAPVVLLVPAAAQHVPVEAHQVAHLRG